MPSFLLIIVIVIYPLVKAFYLSFTDARMTSPVTNFIGLLNYKDLLIDIEFWAVYTKNTVLYVGGSVLVEMCLGFGLALILHREIKGRSIFRVIILVPLMVPPVVIALMMKIILDPATGPINYLLRIARIQGPSWFGDVSTALPSVILTDIYHNTPFVTLVLLAGLQTIPSIYYEAAKVDGGGTWHNFKEITLPLLRPYLILVLLFRLALSLKAFDIIFTTTAGGPARATTTLNLQAFFNYYRWGFIGVSATYGIILFLIIFIITQFLIKKTRLHYVQ